MTAKQAAAMMAATYRQFVYACRSEVPPGNCYELSPEARDEWKTQAKAAAKALGLRDEKTEQLKG